MSVTYQFHIYDDQYYSIQPAFVWSLPNDGHYIEREMKDKKKEKILAPSGKSVKFPHSRK